MSAADICKELEDFDRAEGFYKEIIAESRLTIVIEGRARLNELQRRPQLH